jgi:LmbE family N-acetylglucosaminyl deacetylase
MADRSVNPRMVDPVDAFAGRTVVLAPHMDDETLACGGTIAQLARTSPVFVVFTSDGSRSPTPDFRWQAGPPTDLSERRKKEARAALGQLGLDPENIRFLDYPDGRLNRHVESLTRNLTATLKGVEPDVVFIPFRFDRHPDHLATHRAALRAIATREPRPLVVEYFVYYRWRMVPGGDIRRMIQLSDVVQVNTASVSSVKLRALQCYVTQTTCLLDGQRRPILPPKRLADVSEAPEWFLIRNETRPGTEIFERWRPWIPIAHRVEPILKRQKDRLMSFFMSTKDQGG